MEKLEIGVLHYIGNFAILLNEKGELQIQVISAGEKLQISPKASNCILLTPCR